jgi:hypothetical protein
MLKPLRTLVLAVVIASSLLLTAGLASADTFDVSPVPTVPTVPTLLAPLRDITWE